MGIETRRAEIKRGDGTAGRQRGRGVASRAAISPPHLMRAARGSGQRQRYTTHYKPLRPQTELHLPPSISSRMQEGNFGCADQVMFISLISFRERALCVLSQFGITPHEPFSCQVCMKIFISIFQAASPLKTRRRRASR